MRTLIFFIMVLTVTCTACEDKVSLSMNVLRDCTGTYLQYENMDYKVCNPQAVADFSPGQTVKATYTLEDECEDPSVVNYACNLHHSYESLINVTDITN